MKLSLLTVFLAAITAAPAVAQDSTGNPVLDKAFDDAFETIDHYSNCQEMIEARLTPEHHVQWIDWMNWPVITTMDGRKYIVAQFSVRNADGATEVNTAFCPY